MNNSREKRLANIEGARALQPGSILDLSPAQRDKRIGELVVDMLAVMPGDELDIIMNQVDERRGVIK